MTHSRLIVATLASLIGVSPIACDEVPRSEPGAQIALAVAPLDFPGVTNVTYTLTVANKSGQTVFSRALDSRTYGDGAGALTYVGPCDADPAENPNTVSLTLTGLFSGATGQTPIDPATWENPGVLTRPATCAPNADTPVTFDITLARAANQGFFDVAVTFEDIFCSAKLDCVDESGAPLALLHTPEGSRGRSVVLGLACTGDLSASGETWLYRTPIVVTCAGGTATVDPSAGPGNLTAGAGYTTTGTSPLFGAAVYRGEEQFNFDKRYWNVVLGLAATAQSCTVSTRATASPEPLIAGATPEGTTYPYIIWSRALTNAASALACTRHPVDGLAPNDGVSTTYTAPDVPQTFDFAYGPTVIPTLCSAGQATCNLSSCGEILDAGLSTGNGTYAIDPDGPSAGESAIEVWCEMATGTALRLGQSANASWTSISAACPVGSIPFAIDGFARVAIAETFAAAHPSDWYWLNFFAGPGTNVSGALENELGWISSTTPLVWTASGFVDSGPTALPNLDISGNQNQGFHDPIALSRTLGFANRAGSGLIYNSAEQTLLAPVVCTYPAP